MAHGGTHDPLQEHIRSELTFQFPQEDDNKALIGRVAHDIAFLARHNYARDASSIYNLFSPCFGARRAGWRKGSHGNFWSLPIGVPITQSC